MPLVLDFITMMIMILILVSLYQHQNHHTVDWNVQLFIMPEHLKQNIWERNGISKPSCRVIVSSLKRVFTLEDLHLSPCQEYSPPLHLFSSPYQRKKKNLFRRFSFNYWNIIFEENQYLATTTWNWCQSIWRWKDFWPKYMISVRINISPPTNI